MLRPSPNHGTQRLPNDDDDDPNTISKLSAKYQFCAIRTADTRDGKLTTRGVYPWVVHRLSIVYTRAPRSDALQ